MQTLEELKKHFINELIQQGLRRVFYILRQNIDNQSIKYDDLNLLHARYITASHDQNIKGILSSEEARIIFNQIKATLLGFINDLTSADLNLESSAVPASIPTTVKEIAKKATCNKGKIFYKVPEKMELKKERKCIVRVAFDEKELEINDRNIDGSKVEPIRIAEVMEVKFIDQCTDQAFNIRTISSSEQLVDRGDFTEWIFYVKPLLEGTYELILKVSVIEKRLGREIRKDIVLEKKIDVVAAPIQINDRLAIYAEEESDLAIGAGFLIPAGFEVWDQPLILDSFLIPPLDPGLNPPPPVVTPTPRPYPPANELSSIGWLAVATAVLMAIATLFKTDNSPAIITPISPITTNELTIAHSINPSEDLVTLSIKGSYPPFDLNLKNVDDSLIKFSPIKIIDSDSKIFSYYSLGLTPGDSINFIATATDKFNNLSTTNFGLKWQAVGTFNYPPFSTDANPIDDQKNLNLIVKGGTSPFFITIFEENNESKKWNYPLLQPMVFNTDTTFSFSSLKSFPLEGTFVVKVEDATHKVVNTTFSLINNDSINNKGLTEDYLELITSPDYILKRLKVEVIGNQPPFDIFIDQKQVATLTKEGSHFAPFSGKDLVNKENILISVKDKNENTKSAKQKIEIEVPKPIEPLPPIEITNCVTPKQFKYTCSILYIYNEVTNENWRMRQNTFLNPTVINKMNTEQFKVYHLNRKSIVGNCESKIFDNLEKVNTLVFQGLEDEPIMHKGFVSPDKILPSLICFNKKGGIEKGKKSLKVKLKPSLTYKYQTLNGGEDFSISPQKNNQFRVRLGLFNNENNFNDFVQKLQNIGKPIYVRTEGNSFLVFLGGFGTKAEAEDLLKELNNNTEMKRILTQGNIDDLMVPNYKT